MKIPMLAFSALLTAAGCSNEAPILEDPRPGGGKADELLDVELRCDVVQVVDDNVLEEGLGSIYDYDEEGFPEYDSDSIEVSYRFSEFSEHESGRILSVGQHSIGLHDAGDVLRELDETPEFNDEIGFLSVEGQAVDSNMVFKVRVFDPAKVGIVTHRAADVDECIHGVGDFCTFEDTPEEVADCEERGASDCEREHLLAKIDCRGQGPALEE